MEYPKPAPIRMIEDLDTLKVFADPLRNQVMEILAAGPRTIGQVADKLGLQASKLYYHFSLLEKHDFIRVVDTQVKGNLLEKLYWLTAYQCKLAPEIFNFSTPAGQETTLTTMVTTIETTREDLTRSLQARAYQLERGAEEHPREVLIFRELADLTDEQANAFLARLRALAKEFEAFKKSPAREDAHTRALTIACYPSFYYDDQEAASRPD